MRRWISLLLAVGVLLGTGLAPATSYAAGASLAVSPGTINTDVGKTFSVNIIVNAGEPVNAVSGTVNFPANLQATGVSAGGSIITFWTEYPAISGRTVGFGGGLSNPGFVGNGGKLFSISFKVTGAGGGTISISGGKTLANDGQGTNVFTGASSATVNVGGSSSAPKGPNLPVPTISSSSHPDQSKWYKAKDLVLSWNKPSGAQSLKYSLSSPSSSVSKSATTTDTSATFQNLSDGVWTFTLTAVYSAGERANSFKAQIDTVAPHDLEIKYSQKSPTDPFPVLEYSAKDEPSGIDHYEITIDGGAAISTTETSYKLPRQSPGTKNIVVKAVDKAGNSIEKSTTLTVEGFPGPTLLSVTKFLSVLQPLDIVGQGLYGAKTTIFIDGKSVGDFLVKDHLKNPSGAEGLKPDDLVVWAYRVNLTLLPGNHKVTASQAKEDGSESNLSNELITRVLWTSISLAGLIIPMLLVALVLLLIIIALIILLFLLARRRKNCAPETNFPLKNRLSSLEEEISSELDNLARQVDKTVTVLGKKPKALKSQIDAVVDSTKTTIKGNVKKELTDLEDSQSKKS